MCTEEWTTIPIMTADRHCHFLLVVEHLANATSTTPYIWITQFLRRRENPQGGARSLRRWCASDPTPYQIT